MSALVTHLEYKNKRKPITPSSSVRQNLFGNHEPSVSSKPHGGESYQNNVNGNYNYDNAKSPVISGFVQSINNQLISVREPSATSIITGNLHRPEAKTIRYRN